MNKTKQQVKKVFFEIYAMKRPSDYYSSSDTPLDLYNKWSY